MLDLVVKGENINLARYMMDKMISTLRQKIACAKKKTSSHQKVIMPYVTIITWITKSLSSQNSKYEFLPIAVTYNLGFIGKMGYKDVSGKWVNI